MKVCGLNKTEVLVNSGDVFNISDAVLVGS